MRALVVESRGKMMAPQRRIYDHRRGLTVNLGMLAQSNRDRDVAIVYGCDVIFRVRRKPTI